jgi:alpha-beta hydrolase superfamily lysophospholipase
MQQVSLARYLSGAGFDTWILEVRGAGLSKRRGEPTAAELGSVDESLAEQLKTLWSHRQSRVRQR